MQPTTFAVIFEGRTGSSELMARLNAHPSIQAFPEILAPVCTADRDEKVRSEEIAKILDRLTNATAIHSFAAAYSKLGPEADTLPVRGFKTRLNSAADLAWYERVDRIQNFYQVEPTLLLPMLKTRGFKLVRLRRDNLVRQAVSWLRAVQLAHSRDNLWNIPKGDLGLGSLPLDPNLLVHTIAWLDTSRAAVDIGYEAYGGPKLLVTYEDLFSPLGDGIQRLLAFLGVTMQSLPAFHDRLTDEDLSRSITNFGEVKEHLKHWGMEQQLIA